MYRSGGHDFRADYLKLSLLHELFPEIPRIALTATADARTRTEIISRLQLEEAGQFIAGFDRPNICYRIALKHNAKTTILEILERRTLRTMRASCIVYRERRQRTSPIGCKRKASTRFLIMRDYLPKLERNIRVNFCATRE